jgi:MerR family mercuric resistance operon transcriptional regulator
MTIGQLAERTGLSIHTIRYYEALKLLPKPERTEKGYRKYSTEYVKKIKIVKKFQELGFTLKEIKTINNFDDCRELKSLARLKLKDIRDKIQYYRTLERKLKNFILACPYDGSIEECPVIKLITQKLGQISSSRN